MSFKRKKKLTDNIEAIRAVFHAEQDRSDANTREMVAGYQGFGGLGCILLPCEKEEDVEKWKPSDAPLFPLVRELFSLLKENSRDQTGYERYRDSLRQSVLSAFYTPQPIVEAIFEGFHLRGINPGRLLDPSAGNGAFMEAAGKYTQHPVCCFENDLLTGKILQYLYPEAPVYIQGYETIDTGSLNNFDMVASNIPFGKFGVSDPLFYNKKDRVRYNSAKKIHTYYFVKSLDMLHEGGILAFITSQGVMNSPENKEIRRYLMKNADLVSAIRLPNNLFSEDAGTDVGTDLIILQKNTPKKQLSSREKDFIECREVSAGVHINNYYNDFSHVIHTRAEAGKNMYGDPAVLFYHDGGIPAMAETLTRLVRHDCREYLDIENYSNPLNRPARQEPKENSPEVSLHDLMGFDEEERKQISTPKKASAGKTVYNGAVEPFYKKDTLVLMDGSPGRLLNASHSNPLFQPIELDPPDKHRLKEYIHVRDTYFQLYEYELKYAIEYPPLRQELNTAYQDFIHRYGDLNSPGNLRLIRMDSLGSEILTLEKFTGETKTLADIFREPVSFAKDKKLKTKDPKEAFATCLNLYGEVKLDYISRITGKDEDDLIRALKGFMYYNPEEKEFQITEKIITGDVVSKYEAYENLLSSGLGKNEKEWTNETIRALKEALPPQIPYEEIEFNLGERWIPLHYYDEYFESLFHTKTETRYIVNSDQFFLEAEDEYTAEIREKYAVDSLTGAKLDGLYLGIHALLDTVPKIFYTVKDPVTDKEIRIPDTEAMQLATSVIQEFREGFPTWINKQSPDSKQELTNLYNRHHKCRVKPHFDGTRQVFPDLNLEGLKIKDPYQSQKDAVWMLKVNDGGIIDQKVGGGKTLIMVMAAYEMKRLKMASKPMIIGLKSNVDQIAECFTKAYPNAKVLFPSEKDFTKQNREALFHRIKNNNWDAIILTHDQFKRIPQSDEIQEQILKEEKEMLEEDLRTHCDLKGKPMGARVMKGLEIKKKNLEKRLKEIRARIDFHRDDVVDFRTMGIDHLFVDECHYFKNLQYTTRHSEVAGLGNPSGSQRAMNLLFAIRTIQDKKKKDLCATFLSGTTISNSLVELYILFKYLRPRALEEQNIRTFDAWAAVYAKKSYEYEFNVVQQLKQKERFRYFKNVPELAEFYSEITDYRSEEDLQLDKPRGETILKIIPQSEEQAQFLEKLVTFTKTQDARLLDRPPLTDEEKKAIMLITTGYGNKMALDMRLINHQKYKDHPENKLSCCAANIARLYYEFNEQKATQFVFFNLGTYNPHKWNVFDELKRKLVQDYGIPAKEIRAIQEARTQNERYKIITGMKTGDIRITCGTSENLGTGVNAQDRAIASHRLTIPWKPSEDEQGKARAERPGNWVAKEFNNNTVYHYVYAAEKSLDIYKFNLLELKQLFINQLRSGNVTARHIDEGAISGDKDVNYTEMLAQLSDNKELLEKLRVEKKIAVLESERKAFNKTLMDAQYKLKESQTTLEKKTTIMNGMENDYRLYKTQIQSIPSETNPFRIDGFITPDERSTGEALHEIARKTDTKGEYKQIGEFFNFGIVVITKGDQDYKVNRFYIQGEVKYAYNGGKLSVNPQNVPSDFTKAFEKIPALVQTYRNDIEHLHKYIPVLQEMINTPWKKEEELKGLKQTLKELDSKLTQTIQPETDIPPILSTQKGIKI